MCSFQWESISQENTNICTAKDYHQKTLKQKAPHTTLVLWVLPCIYIIISFLARALLCRNRRLVFHVSQEANVHDTCLNSIFQRQPMHQEDDIVYLCILWRSMVKIKTQTTANEATSGMAASSQREASSTGPVSTSAQSCIGCKTPRTKGMR